MGCTPNGRSSAPVTQSGASTQPVTQAASTNGSKTEKEKGTTAGSPLSFLENDYTQALALAKSTHRLLFVDSWALWCHSCMSLRETVLVDPKLAPLRDKFVWLAIDTEHPSNTLFLEKYPVKSLPTLWVIDPNSATPVWKWLGTLTAPELVTALSEIAVDHAAPSRNNASSLSLADRAFSAGDAKGAVAHYRQALEQIPAANEKRKTVVDTFVAALEISGESAECVRVSGTELPNLRAGTSRANVIQTAIRCAIELEPTARKKALPGFIRAGEDVAHDPQFPILPDDRSGVFEHLVDAKKALSDTAGVRTTAREWAAFLETEANRARTPRERAIFDSHRLGAYLELGEPARAVPMLEQSERDIAGDYNAAARLARAYFEMKAYDKAVAAADRAIALAYGPRKLRIYELKANILKAANRTNDEQRTLSDALAYANTLPVLSAGYTKLRNTLEARLTSKRD